jgi:hypothetical protein
MQFANWRGFARHRGSRTQYSRLAVGLALFVPTVLIAVSSGAGAVDPTGAFELDGNVAPTTTVDWQNTNATTHNGFFDATHTVDASGNPNPVSPLPAGFSRASFVRDFDLAGSTKDFTTFTNGSADVSDIANWACVGVNNVTDKGDITNAYAAARRDPGTGHVILYFGIEKNASNGDNNVAVWFLKDGTVGCDNTKIGGGGVSFHGHHTDGDTLLAAAFTNGGQNPTIKEYKWVGGANGSLDTAHVNTGTKCGFSTNPNLCAITNTAADLTPPWPTSTKTGTGVPKLQFYEGGADITALTGESCFARFLANTRASQSETAALYDFATGSFPTCNPSTSVTASPSTANPEIAVAGQNVTFSWTETNDGDIQLTDVHMVTDNAACNTAMTPTTATLNATQSQVFSCTIATPSTAQVFDIVGTGHGTSPLGDVTFCGASPPANTVCDAQERATARAVTIIPGTELSASASPTTTKAGDTVTFTITDANDGVAPAGYESYLALTANTITASSTTAGVATDCNNELALPVSGDTVNPTVLDSGETWTFQCTVTAPSDDFSITFDGSGTALAGTTHQVTVNFASDSEERDSASVTVIAPNTEITVTANAVITYTFKEANTSADAALAPPTVGVRESVITTSGTPLSMCNVSAVAYVSGDTGNDKVLGTGETWVFSCQGSLAGPTTDTGSASQSSTGVGHGIDATGDDVTFCSPTCSTSQQHVAGERDRIAVTITNTARG